jgi:hypothetical protein
LACATAGRCKYEYLRHDKSIYSLFSCCFFERVGCRPDLVGTGAELAGAKVAWRATGARRVMSFKWVVGRKPKKGF